jgi:MFS family permease
MMSQRSDERAPAGASTSFSDERRIGPRSHNRGQVRPRTAADGLIAPASNPAAADPRTQKSLGVLGSVRHLTIKVARNMAVNADIGARAVSSEGGPPVESQYPPSSQAWYCVFALALAVMINFLDRGILTLLVEPIKRDLQLSDVQMSLIMGFAFTFFYAVLGLPVARLVDRKSRKLIMTAGITIWSAMTMLCGLATNFWYLFFARMGLGVGETTSGPSAYSLLSDYFPPHRLPRAISFMQVGFVVGTGLSLILGAWIIDFVAANPDLRLPLVGQLRGWQMVLMLVGLPGFVVAAIMASVREPPRRGGAQAEPTPVAEIFRFILRHKLVYLPLFIGMGLRTVQMFGTQAWGPAFYGRTYGWTPRRSVTSRA